MTATAIPAVGASSGAIRAAAFAQAEPEAVERLVLVALTYKGSRAPTLRDRSKQVEFYRTHYRRPRDRAMIRSIFTRDSLATSYDIPGAPPPPPPHPQTLPPSP